MTNVTVTSSAIVEVSGAAFGSLIADGGEEELLSGGSLAGAAVEAGGTLVLLGGTASDTTVTSGGAVGVGGDITGDVTDGEMTSTTVVSGVTVLSGGFIDPASATVESGAVLSLAAGAVASSLVIQSGGVVLGPGELAGVSSDGGRVSGVQIEGELSILSDGSAVGARIGSDGYVDLNSGGSATGTVVSTGGNFFVQGDSISAVIKAGGEEQFGTTVSGDTVQSGGVLEFFGDLSGNLTVPPGGHDQQPEVERGDPVQWRGSAGGRGHRPERSDDQLGGVQLHQPRHGLVGRDGAGPGHAGRRDHLGDRQWRGRRRFALRVRRERLGHRPPTKP